MKNSQQKWYYGIRYLGGNRSCTTGDPHPRTFRTDKAVDIVAFPTAKERDDWVAGERLSAPTGSGGGERIAATKRICREHCMGNSMDEFNSYIEHIQWEYKNNNESGE